MGPSNPVGNPYLKNWMVSLSASECAIDGEMGNKYSVRVCVATIRNASYSFQSILVTGNILAYLSFFEKIRPVKRVCTYKFVNFMCIIDYIKQCMILYHRPICTTVTKTISTQMLVICY